MSDGAVHDRVTARQAIAEHGKRQGEASDRTILTEQGKAKGGTTKRSHRQR